MGSLQRILKDSIIQLIDLWSEALSDDYLLHVKHTHYQKNAADNLLIDHYLFGDIDWNLFNPTRWHKQNTFHTNAKLIDVKTFINGKSKADRIELSLLSNDLIYAFHFQENGSPCITMDLSSAIFGKGTYYRYVVATHIDDNNWLLSSPFDRGKKYEGFQDTLLQCAQHIFYGENEMEHPYQYMIDNYPDIYRDRDITIHKKRFFLDPEDATAYVERGLAYYKKGEYDEAIADYDEAIRLNPKYAAAYESRGFAYRQKDDWDRARDDNYHSIKLEADKQIAFDPENANAYKNRGNSYSYKGEYDLAIADYDEAIKLDPEDVAAYENRGLAYYAKGNYDRAMADHNEAIRYDEADRNAPNSPQLYLNRGNLYEEMGDYGAALKDYDASLRLCLDYADFSIDSDFILVDPDTVDTAIKLLDSVVEDYYRSENFADAAYYSGVSILFTGNTHIARENFERARDLGFEDDAKITEHLENLKNRE